METTTYRTLDGRDVELSLNPAIGFRQAARTLAEDIAELTDGVRGVYVETGRAGSEANVRDATDGPAWRRLDMDAFLLLLGRPESIERIRAARDRPAEREPQGRDL